MLPGASFASERGATRVSASGGLVVATEGGPADVRVEPDAMASTVTRALDLMLSSYSPDIADLADRLQRPLDVYTEAHVLRRVRRRCLLTGSTLESYPAALSHPEERALLARELTDHRRAFFRDPEMWDALLHGHLVPLVRRLGPDDCLRVWVPHCGPGHDALATTILVLEAMELTGCQPGLKLYASDPSTTAVDDVVNATFPSWIRDEVSPERLARWFEWVDGRYRPVDELVNRLVFARHDLLTDPPLFDLHLIVCRSVLTSLRPRTRHEVLEQLYNALRDGGILALDAEAEPSLFGLGFESVRPGLQVRRAPHATTARPAPKRALARHQRRRLHGFDGPFLAADLQRRAGVLLFVERDGTVTRVLGDASLPRPQPGNLSTHLRSLLDPRLATALLSGLQQATPSQPVTYSELGAPLDGVPMDVRIACHEGHDERFFTVALTRAPLTTTAADADSRIRLLERELAAAREELHLALEQLDNHHAAGRTLREALSMTHEELQSTHEELESANEEIHTINAEYGQRLRNARWIHDALGAVLESTGQVGVMLDGSGRVSRFTPGAATLLQLRPDDRGRLARELPSLCHGELSRRLELVLDTPQSLREVVHAAGRDFHRHLLPLRGGGRSAAVGVLLAYQPAHTPELVRAMATRREVLHGTDSVPWAWDVRRARFEDTDATPTALGLPVGTVVDLACLATLLPPTTLAAWTRATEGPAVYRATWELSVGRLDVVAHRVPHTATVVGTFAVGSPTVDTPPLPGSDESELHSR
jgi:two-component system CheB/CheR fusion protein